MGINQTRPIEEDSLKKKKIIIAAFVALLLGVGLMV